MKKTVRACGNDHKILLYVYITVIKKQSMYVDHVDWVVQFTLPHLKNVSNCNQTIMFNCDCTMSIYFVLSKPLWLDGYRKSNASYIYSNYVHVWFYAINTVIFTILLILVEHAVRKFEIVQKCDWGNKDLIYKQSIDISEKISFWCDKIFFVRSLCILNIDFILEFWSPELWVSHKKYTSM